jgi:hypothetical protein
MFKNEVLGTHKDMQMRFIDELVSAHKKFQKVSTIYSNQNSTWVKRKPK